MRTAPVTRSPRTIWKAIAPIACAAAMSSPSFCASDPNAPLPAPGEYVEVTTTRVPEPVEEVPATVTIITGAELRARGVTDLSRALALAAGVDVGPGGDGGPRSSVPELWGLREFDAFLLVVDGVPWGGAFNPALATVDLLDVDRIEVVRGAAPVMYGATSFSGVIQIIRRAPGTGEMEGTVSGGSYGAGGVSASAPLPVAGKLRSTVGGNLDRLAFRDDRTQADRGQALWRGALPLPSVNLSFTANAIWLGQDPASPHPREGRALSDNVTLDADHNPGDSHLNERRLFASVNFDRTVGKASWAGTAAFTRSDQSVFRGFLTDVVSTAPNAVGFREVIATNDVYLDMHLAFSHWAKAKAVFGIDHLHGDGEANGGDFDYFVELNGDNPPSAESLPSQAAVRVRDRREFSGAYAWGEWTPFERWRFEGGWRLNRTDESRAFRAEEFGAGTVDSASDRQTVLRGSGAAGVTFTAWRDREDAVRLFAEWRDTYKPAAVDFGLDSEDEILAPETSQSWEGGVKAVLLDGKLLPQVSFFRMDFDNLVISQSNGGIPSLTNAGTERFQGVEVEADWIVRENLHARGAWSFHDAQFRDFLTEFGGVPTQLRDNRLEMSARVMGGAGIAWSPARGWIGSAEMNVVGNRFLNKRNTALAPAYSTAAAGVGYRADRWEIRFDGQNLTNRRPPISESELGDAQYYLLPARSFRLTLGIRV